MAGYTCGDHEFIYNINDNGEVKMSGYKLKCKNLENNNSLITTNIFDGLAIPMFTSYDENTDRHISKTESKLVSKELFTDLIGFLNNKERIHNDCYSRKNKKFKQNRFTRRHIR